MAPKRPVQPGALRAYAISPVESDPKASAIRARELGFGGLLALGADATGPAWDTEPQRASIGAIAGAAKTQRLEVLASLWLDSIWSHHALAASDARKAFRPVSTADGVVDPRRPFEPLDGLEALTRPDDAALLAWWRARLDALRALGVVRFAVIDPSRAGQRLAARLREHGYPVVEIPSLSDGPLVAGSWSASTPLAVGDPKGQAQSDADHRRWELACVAFNLWGWVMPSRFEEGLETAVASLNQQMVVNHGPASPVRAVTGSDASLQIIVGGNGLLLAHNRTEACQSWPPANLPFDVAGLQAVAGFTIDGDLVAPHQTLLFHVAPTTAVRTTGSGDARTAADPELRITIGSITPAVDGGAFAVKRLAGEALAVRADIFADGHELIAAELLFRAEDEAEWRRVRMTAEPNDVWTAAVRGHRLGRHILAIEAWLDIWGGFVRDFGKKREAGLDLTLERQEGRALVAAAVTRATGSVAADLAELLARFEAASPADQDDLLGGADLITAMAAADDRPFQVRSFEQPVEVERTAAGFSSWYELFPRSQTDNKARHGTFADVAARLPQVAAMGFDTLYFPPIHPIGVTNRKGPNNSLTSGPDDVGSPYAIGGVEGGHDAIHPQLGTLDDFRALLSAAKVHGLEIALDFAIQCSPDHPWLKSHPDWFAWRPDGSMKYAENPPKKYQDIVNVDFYGPGAVPGLWEALRDVVLFWAAEGVRAFRVDNPHTKPLPFWRWMIAEVKARHPDAIFLSEAFTRPKPMYQLAKVGFSQSYTYFTWRTGKAEFTDYLTELTQTPVREFYRPHFFVNTPDIDPYFLQTSGRPGFLIRAALAATLSGLFGVYSGFELCEAAPLPGREEYLDSEKYEIRPRPTRAPGDIVDEITQLNALRRAEPALQTHLGVAFHNAFNDQVLYYSKAIEGEAYRILVAVSLDPHHAQDADFEVPLWLFGLADHDSVQVDDLLSGRRSHWTGKIQRLRLTPDNPYAIWRIAPLQGV
jgi:starch synthase (maltosyl-transferring)